MTVTKTVPDSAVSNGESTALQEQCIREVFNNLNAAGIRYVVPRNWDGLPHSVGKDLDVLLPAGELWPAVRLIRAAAARLGFASVVHRTDGQGLVVDVIPLRVSAAGAAAPGGIGFDLRTYVSFDLTRVRVPGATYKVFADKLHRRLVTLSGCEIQVLATIDEFICLYSQYQHKRALKMDRKVSEYAERLKLLLVDPEVAAWVGKATGCHDSKALQSQVFELDCWKPFASTLVRRRWGRMTILRWPAMLIRAGAIRVRFLWPCYGPIVYFSGPDGAGKTTITDRVKARLRTCGVRFKYLYSLKIVIRAITKRLAFVRRIGRRKFSSDAGPAAEEAPDLLFLTEDAHDRDTGSAFWRFRKLMALLVGIIDIWIGWLLALPLRLCGWTVLVETAPYDIFIKYHMPEFTVVERLLGPLLPNPSVGFLLKAEPEQIIRRKSELTVAEIADYYSRFARVLELCRARDRYRVVRTDIDPDDTVVQVTEVVLSTVA